MCVCMCLFLADVLTNASVGPACLNEIGLLYIPFTVTYCIFVSIAN